MSSGDTTARERAIPIIAAEDWEPVMTETARGLARRLRSMRVDLTDMALAHCSSCDNTGVAPEEVFGRDADGAPMVDGVQPCPRGCAVPDWLRLEIQEPSDWLKDVSAEPSGDTGQARESITPDTPGRPQAIAYAGLLGRWIDVDRVVSGEVVSMAGNVEEVRDVPSGAEVILDYGYGIVITSDNAADWHFRVRVEGPS